MKSTTLTIRFTDQELESIERAKGSVGGPFAISRHAFLRGLILNNIAVLIGSAGIEPLIVGGTP
jgi:hypothetical protein|tara:strand:+ start:399 stop:590 length:192 start_codon:yes stop_codon:yes gene_type:complete